MYAKIYRFLRQNLFRGGKEIQHYLSNFDQYQTLSLPELKKVQLRKLQDLVAYAYEHVPFYKDRYQHAGIHPTDIRSIEDFQALPCLTRDDVRQYPETLTSKEYSGQVYWDTTSGSTGTPMRFLMDRSSAYWSNAIETRFRGQYGVAPGDRRAWVWGYDKDFDQWPLKNRLKAYLKRHRYLNALTINDASLKAFADMLSRWQPAMIRAYPSSLALFAHYLKDHNITNITPKLIEVSGEKISSSQRSLFKEVFQAPVADCYSSWEIYDIAYQCPDEGLHVSEDRYVELVSEDKIVEPGQLGEIVVTSLTQRAMPFIRYKNEDLGTYSANACPCGRSAPVLSQVTGRKVDMLCMPDCRFVDSGIFDHLMQKCEEVTKFQVYQKDTTHIELRLVFKGDIDTPLIDLLRKELQDYFGEEMDLAIKAVERLELTKAGKHQYIISDIDQKHLW